MKMVVYDLTHQYNVCIVDDYEEGLKIAKQYVKKFFEVYNKQSKKLKKYHMQDVIKRKLIGIDISEVNYKTLNADTRTNYFFGNIKEDGTIINKNMEDK